METREGIEATFFFKLPSSLKGSLVLEVIVIQLPAVVARLKLNIVFGYDRMLMLFCPIFSERRCRYGTVNSIIWSGEKGIKQQSSPFSFDFLNVFAILVRSTALPWVKKSP